MKILINIYSLFFFIITTSFAQKTYDHFKIQVDGLGCPFCAYGLEKKFKELKGLKKVNIAIESGNFDFKLPSDPEFSMKSAIEQVKKAGYTPKSAIIERASGTTETFPNLETKVLNSLEDFKTLSFKVQGNCEMCKARIEAKAISIDGVSKAKWSVASKVLEIETTKESLSEKAIGIAIASEGHSNSHAKADKQAYNNLPPCCNYKK